MRLLVPALACLMLSCAKKPAPVSLQSPEDLVESQLNAVVRELVPLVEAAAGASFDEVPFVRLGRRTDLERIVRSEAMSTFDLLYPDAPTWRRDQFLAGMHGEGIAGKYALNERILLVSPESMARLAGQLQDDPLALDHVTRLVLAHELAHALQDQRSGIASRFDTAPHLDAFQALRGVTEGHANFVETRVAEALGLEHVEEVLNGSQGWDADGPDNAYSFSTWAAYGQGQDFVRFHADQGGLPRTWEVLSTPPERSRTIFVPEEYGAERPVDAADFALLDEIEDSVREERWFITRAPLLELDLRQRLFGVPAPELEQALAGVRDGAQREASRTDRSVRSLWVHTEDVAAAEALLALHRDHAELLAAELNPVSGSGVYQVQSEADLGDDAIRVLSGPSLDGDAVVSVQRESHALWVRVGADVVLVEAVGMRPGSALTTAATELVARVRARDAGAGQGGAGRLSPDDVTNP